MRKKYLPLLIAAEAVLLLSAIGIVVWMNGDDVNGLFGLGIGLLCGIVFLLLSFSFSALRRARYNIKVLKKQKSSDPNTLGIYIKPIPDVKDELWRVTTQELGKLSLYGSIENDRSGKRSLLVKQVTTAAMKKPERYGIYDGSKNNQCLAVLTLVDGTVSIKPVGSRRKVKWNNKLLNKDQNWNLRNGDRLEIGDEAFYFRDAVETVK